MIVLPEPITPGRAYEVKKDGYGAFPLSSASFFSTKAFEDAFSYTGDDLGVVWTPAETRFRLWAPTADKVVLNITDTIYFHYAQKRITSDEFSYFNNSNTALIMLISIRENWYMLLLGIALILGSALLYRKIKYNRSESGHLVFYISNSVFFIVMVFLLIIAIRGGVSRAIRPITLSNALQFSESPSKAYIVLNNPFCIIKTLNKDQNNYSRYFSEQELDSLYYPSHKGSNQQQMKRKNVVIFILESFSYEHSAFLNPQLYPDGTKYTPIPRFP
jgi:hypothetical protein